MAMDLIISKNNDVLITSNKPFARDIVRVDFDIVNKKLTLQYDYTDDSGLRLNMFVPEKMMQALLKAPAITLAHIDQNTPVSGYIVPLIQSEIAF